MMRANWLRFTVLVFGCGLGACGESKHASSADSDASAPPIDPVGVVTARFCSYDVFDAATASVRELKFSVTYASCDPMLAAFGRCDATTLCLPENHCEDGICMRGPGVACRRDAECMSGARCVGIDWSIDKPGTCKSDAACLDASGQLTAEGTTGCAPNLRRCRCSYGEWGSCTADVACGSQCDATHACADREFACTNGTCVPGAADHFVVMGTTSMLPTCPGAQVLQERVLVAVMDDNDKPVPGVEVSFTALDGGAVEFPTATTNELGIARPGKWMAGNAYGKSRLVVNGKNPLPGKAGRASIALSVEVKDFPACHMSWDAACQTLTPATAASTPPDLVAWLTSHPRVAASLRLVLGEVLGREVPTAVAWASWPSADRATLVREFTTAWQWLAAGMVGGDPDPIIEPPANILTEPAWLADGDLEMSVADSKKLFLKTVAMSLAVELQQRVPWRLDDYDDAALTQLFDHGVFHVGTRDLSLAGGIRVTGMIPPPPMVAAQFVAEHGLACTSRVKAIEATVFWARHLTHAHTAPPPDSDSTAYPRAQCLFDHWQYAGPPLGSRTLARTVYAGWSFTGWMVPDNVDRDPHPAHYTSGCHASVDLMRSLLRTLNIPAAYVNAGHATAHFLADGLWLSHGDDPYMVFWNPIPFPTRALLLDESEFAALYPNGYEQARAGARLVDLEMQYPGPALLSYHYLDLLAGRSHADSLVLDYLTTYRSSYGYTADDFERSSVWARLDELVAPYFPLSLENHKLMLYHYGMLDRYDPRSPKTLAY